jgi:hypothetical protein
MDAKPLAAKRQTSIAIGHHIAFEQMLKGPSDDAWYDLAAGLNMALVLAERGFGDEWIDEIKASMIGMMRAKYRAKRTGTLALDADAIKAIRTVLEIHDQQIAIAKRADIKAAAQTIVARMESGDAYAETEMRRAA